MKPGTVHLHQNQGDSTEANEQLGSNPSPIPPDSPTPPVTRCGNPIFVSVPTVEGTSTKYKKLDPEMIIAERAGLD